MSERAIVEAVLYDNSVYYELGLTYHDFNEALYRRLFKAASSLIEKGVEADKMSLAESEGVNASDVALLEPFTAANVEHYAEKLKERSRVNRLGLLSKSIADFIAEGMESADILDRIERDVLAISERRENRVKRIGEYLHEAVNDIERIYHAKGEPTGVPSGFSDLDAYTFGFQPSDLIVIAARTSIGKTAFALNMAENQCLSRRSVGFFSLEMTSNQMCHRLLSSVGRLQHSGLRKGKWTESSFQYVGEAASKLYDAPMWLDVTPNISWADLKNRARMMKREGCEIIYIDYLTLVSYSDGSRNSWETLGNLVKQIKQLARELMIPIVVISQLNRAAENKRPSLAELRQSGAIEEHSDVIMLLHRERGEAETKLLLEKHRNGATGQIDLIFRDQYTRFDQSVKT